MLSWNKMTRASFRAARASRTSHRVAAVSVLGVVEKLLAPGHVVDVTRGRPPPEPTATCRYPARPRHQLLAAADLAR